MVSVQEITRSYGNQLAVDHVSFEIATGEIVGFIGPNGAGKSTTMKIITGILSPDEGEVLINGIPVTDGQTETRRSIGYLPENNPLYHEMYIREYLSYVAGLYGITGKRASGRTGEVMEMTGLHPEAHKKIGNLSKGYRQRVGLAQALIHDPAILIMDEPTSGLDPNQLNEIRLLISSIGKEKTVLLSTHILQEVEAICDRVLIISRGRIVTDSRSDLLRTLDHGRTQTLQVELGSEVDPEIWKKLPFVHHGRSLENNQFLLETRED
ncbi:MAG: ATP-binding cassette domain-containing protein, partial [Bacteroidetes bacterium]